MDCGKRRAILKLLIVVAIIAVLVAIAVPLFVGQLKDAEDTVKNANMRAVKGTAVAAILGDTGKFMSIKQEDGSSKDAKGWTVTAEVSKTGDITVKSIVPSDTAIDKTSKKDSCEKNTADKTKYDVTVYLNSEDLNNISDKAS